MMYARDLGILRETPMLRETSSLTLFSLRLSLRLCASAVALLIAEVAEALSALSRCSCRG